jgi:hypothetical protein
MRMPTERRFGPRGGVARRFQVWVPIEFEGASVDGNGVTWDISTSGIRIERATTRAEPGTPLTVQFSLAPGGVQLSLDCEAVRHTDSGFAVRILGMTEDQLHYLEAALPAALESG